jgi:pseudouridine-5'-phosphate glycosidase
MSLRNLPTSFDLSDEVEYALAHEVPVVALESTIVVHGLPAPQNREVARACEDAIRAVGAVPATVGLLEGRVVIGLSANQLEQLCDPGVGAAKLSARDIGVALARKESGATTVAGTISLAARAGIDVMATGGLGGVHRGAQLSFDESADLTALSRTSTLVVASGVKSILDVAATLERLDSLGVPVLGYRTTSFPGFYLSDAGFALDWSVDGPDQAAEAFRYHRGISPTGMLLANPIAPEKQLDPALHDEALRAALDHAERVGASGKAVTPIVLAEFARFTAGASVGVNQSLVVSNAAVAAAVAVALSS